jgi:DNA-binding NarL/FixJ family response regulator
MNGLDAARKLKFQKPGLPIVMLTLHNDDFMLTQAAAGIDAVVAKSDNLSSLFEQINRL